ncbi:MAG: 1-phosphofructokinase family hexose kinase, partial [Chloroflexi bacterium]|nr:1-phosphofructokinase family hexose kinase [Chloroflexota bacterium]
ILCVGTTPAAQRVMLFRHLVLDAVNRAVTTLDGAAGKSINVAKVLKALGEEPVATGFLGGDRGENLRALLAEKGIELDFVTVTARTRQCVTVIDQSAGTHTELVEESRPVDPADFEKLLTIVRRRMHGCQAVVMSGTITPGGPADFYWRCTRLAREAGAIAVVDAQGAALLEALNERPDLVKPNRPELAATVGRELKDEAAVMLAMQELGERGAQRVVVTAGKNPALAYDGKSFWRIRAPRLAALNPIGSGDAFAAGLVWRLVRGEDLGEACRWGSAAGAANALTPMAGEVKREEVERLMREVNVERI